MTNEQFKLHIAALRRFGPTWANLRVIGNSRPVQIATVFPVVGYFILLSTQFTHLIDGGIAGSDNELSGRLWSLKLYFVYFGLIALGLGSALYQARCPRIVKNFSDNAEFVRMQGDAISQDELWFMAHETVPFPDVATQDEYVVPLYRIPVMTNYYSLESHRRPWSRVLTTGIFGIGFALLGIPSVLTFLKVGTLLWTQL